MELKDVVITKEHIAAAKAANACSVNYKPGTPVVDIKNDHLEWFEKNCPEAASELASELAKACGLNLSGRMPLAYSGYGYGYGYGYGSGDGYGYGDGDGDGDGYGDGYGDG